MKHTMFNDDYPIAQLGVTVLICLSCFILFFLIGYLAAIPLFHINLSDLSAIEDFSNPKNIALQKYFQIIQAIGMFLVPPLILGKIFSGNSFQFLKLNKGLSRNQIFLIILIMFTAIPFINLIAELNSMIRFPEFMSGFQQYIDRTSKTYEKVTEAFMKVSTLKGLVTNLLIIAIIPALGEELLFRGVFQRIFINWTRNIHWGIVISAFVFSTLHFEFYGFFARWFLGIMFGYFLVWSGSIWLPIVAHFVNNATAVIIYYLINNGIINTKAADFGSSLDILPYTVVCSLISGIGFYFLYKKRDN